MGALLRLLSDKMRMLREDAVAVSSVVEEAFAGHSELDDDVLDKDLRQVFYDLQDSRILEVRRVEVRRDGQERRQYMWRVREDDGLAEPDAAPQGDPTERMYQRLGSSAWERRRPLDK